MASLKTKFYERLPIWAQNLAISAEGCRIQLKRRASHHGSLANECARRKELNLAQLEDLRSQRLGQHFLVARGSAFWRARFEQHGVNPAAGNPIAELSKLPILSKEEVKLSAVMILNANLPRKELHSVNTSGTTGAGLHFWETREAENERWAVWWRYRASQGITPQTWCHYFGGRSIVPIHQARPPYWRTNFPGRQILYSAYHLREETASDYLRKIKESDAPWVHGYPSVIALVADHIRRCGDNLGGRVKVVTTGAENLLAHQRRSIASAFCAPVFQHYGQAESVANFSECIHGRMHVDEDFSFVEFVPIEGRPGHYRVIGTNWTNPAFPLFRYDTGDIATLSSDSPCACGSCWRQVDSVDGRQEDYVINGKGAVIGRLDHIFKDAITVREAQVRQEKPGVVTIMVVPGAGYVKPADEDALLAAAYERLGSETQIHIEYADSLPRTSTGKLRMVVSSKSL